MRKYFFVSIALFWVGFSWGQQIEEREVAPGVEFARYSFPEIPRVINVVKVELRRPNLRIKTVKAGNRIAARERTSILARQAETANQQVLVAINGDFFAVDGTPVNTQVIDGQILKDPGSNSAIGFSREGRPFISPVHLQAAVISPKGDVLGIDGINRRRNKDELIFYNQFRGERTGTNIWGAEISLKNIDPWVVNDTVRVVVVAIDSTRGDQPISPGGAVLSGHDRARNWLLRNTRLGDTLRLVISLPPVSEPIAELIGGIPRIVRDGRISIEEGYASSSFALSPHPRTAIGFNRDTTALYLITVDGRQPDYSMGMTLKELAQFMISLGVYQALNLDGGGSTTMVIQGQIVNRPSDTTGERPVANGLLVIATLAPGTSDQKLKKKSP